MTRSSDIAIVGAGIIGRSWAVCFARAGREVRLFDYLEGAAAAALPGIADMLDSMAPHGLLNGQAPRDVAERITATDSLARCVSDAGYIQESAPERLDIKRRIFAEIAAASDPEAIIASSASALLPSQVAAGSPAASRCLVAHPLNPPHLIPAVEIVPSPETLETVIRETCDLMRAIGQKPVLASREIEGFIMNRLQGALLDEAFGLVASGVAHVEDIDTAMRDGLARRWSLMGPFETIDLNAPGGIEGFIERYGPAYAEIGAGRPNREPWSGALVEEVIAACRAARPVENLPDRQAWRDARLAALASFLSRPEAGED